SSTTNPATRSSCGIGCLCRGTASASSPASTAPGTACSTATTTCPGSCARNEIEGKHMTRIYFLNVLRPLLAALVVDAAASAHAATARASAPAKASPREEIARMPDAELRELTKLAFFWGMHPVAMYERRFALAQAKGAPTFVGEGRLYWDRKPRTAEMK